MLEAGPTFPSLIVRDWARRLFAYEGAAASPSRPAAPATLRVYEKLRKQLSTPVGVDGFQTLASRALVLARSEFSMLSSVQIMPDGSLHGVKVDSEAARTENGEAGVVLIAHLLSLILTLLGEETTRRLIEDVRLQAEVTPGPDTRLKTTKMGSTGAPAGFEDILREVERLRSASEALEGLANNHAEMEEGLLTVAGNIRSIATVLDVFVLVRSKSAGLKDDSDDDPFTRYIM